MNREALSEPMRGFLAEREVPFTVAFDPAGRTAEAFQVPAMPSSFVLGRGGEILHAQAGFDPAKTADIRRYELRTDTVEMKRRNPDGRSHPGRALFERVEI